MNILQTLKKRGFFSTNWIYNKTVLYVIFVIALTNLFVLFQQEDIFSILFFLLVGFLTSFFSKNMVVILCICLFFTNILKYGRSAAGHREGFDSEKKDEGKKKDDEVEKKGDEKKDDEKKDDEKKVDEKKKDMNPENKSESFDSANNDGKTDTDPMLLKQEKLLDNMNKYKSLLDTLQGITQNMKDLKGVSS